MPTKAARERVPAPATAPVSTTTPIAPPVPVISPAPAPPTAKPVEMADAPRTLVFRTTPAGAKVKIKSTRSGRVVEGVTPATFTLPSDIFTWEVSLADHVGDESRQRTIDLVSKRADTVSISLTPLGDRPTRLRSADAAFARSGGCVEAIRLYESIEQPADLGSVAGSEWVGTRLRVGQCHRNMRDYDKAIASFEQVLAVTPGQWSAKYELGLTLCDAKDFGKGKQHFREMEGPFLGQVSADRKQYVRLLARYGGSICKYQELAGKAQPERFTDLRDETESGLEEFVDAAEAALKGRVPEDIKRGLSQALLDAKKKLTAIPGA